MKKTKDTDFKDVPKWIKELVEYQKKNNDKEFLKDMKTDFLEERIFVFTPKGDVIDLPIGSSAVDFAYSIHSDIGAICPECSKRQIYGPRHRIAIRRLRGNRNQKNG